MSPQCDRHANTRNGNGGYDLAPRVVILDSGETARVEVLELPQSATVGYAFCHSGRSWHVTGRRTADRVLIAAPVEN
jgi:hypothetical protein